MPMTLPTFPLVSTASGESFPSIRAASISSSLLSGYSIVTLSMNLSFCASGKGYVPSYSIGFCVANTVKYGDSTCVSRSIVTRRSCIAWSSADCVLAGARFISSARRKVVNTGPLTSVNSFFCMLKTFVPVMSAGIRSGVNCIREKSHPNTCASVLTSRVFATPGTPSINTWLPVKIATRAISIALSCPMTTFDTSFLAVERTSLRRLVSVFILTSFQIVFWIYPDKPL